MKTIEISTPALIVDKNIYEENHKKMSALLEGSSLKLRPHYKSHKCSAIAHEQIKNGAIGMTCAKLEEAIDLADSGIQDILIANQITDKSKIALLGQLARTCRLTVCVDNKENILEIEKSADLAQSTVYCLIEYDIGMERCGVLENKEIIELAKVIDNCPHLVFDGIQAYAGHISHVISLEERKKATERNSVKLKQLLEQLKQNGLTSRVLSGGSTGTCLVKAKENLYTELQAGSYLFMDATYKDLNLPFENSLFILCTVVSVRDGLVVVDAGVKSCGVDQGMPVPVGFSVSEVVASEEHFQLHNPSKKFSVGEKVLLVPAHCCSTINLHNKLYFVDKDKVVDRCFVTARGCFH